MHSSYKLVSEGFMPIYKELSDIIGPGATYAVYQRMRGQQILFPKKLYTTEYILDEICKKGEDIDLQKIDLEFDYTERYLRQLLKLRIQFQKPVR